jgi:hypothetical protein
MQNPPETMQPIVNPEPPIVNPIVNETPPIVDIAPPEVNKPNVKPEPVIPNNSTEDVKPVPVVEQVPDNPAEPTTGINDVILQSILVIISNLKGLAMIAKIKGILGSVRFWTITIGSASAYMAYVETSGFSLSSLLNAAAIWLGVVAGIGTIDKISEKK